ncbi:MAG: hypothetical protein KME59_21330 [Trichormus sp. ATA11-4-KO1]|jgi:hypothetical protein|nr:hypothetical protein [Trichormus sp. ATA11-4-KO1]
MVHELLGNHKASSEWYTPEDIWGRIRLIFNEDHVYDPCPAGGLAGLEADWSLFNNIYVNPPTPAAPWALKALQTHKDNPEVDIIFACFSEAVLWQVNELQDHLVCWVRKRISWIDGNQTVKGKPNSNYLKPAKSPRNYNAFVCLTNNPEIRHRFLFRFQDLGTIRTSIPLN